MKTSVNEFISALLIGELVLLFIVGVQLGIPATIIYIVGYLLEWNWYEPNTIQYTVYVVFCFYAVFIVLRFIWHTLLLFCGLLSQSRKEDYF